MQRLAQRGIATLPAIKDLLDRLRFAPEEGRISLGGQRMLLLHATAVQALRDELIETLGLEGARATLTRMGYRAQARNTPCSVAKHWRPSVAGTAPITGPWCA